MSLHTEINVMKTYSQIINLLNNWESLDDSKLTHLKMLLMPEDDPSMIFFKVFDHPGKDVHGNIIITRYHIEVYDDQYYFCDIIVDCTVHTITYTFT